MTKTFSSWLAVCTALLTLLWSQPPARADDDWTAQAVSNGPLMVRSVHLRAWKQGVLVSGMVARRIGYDYWTDAGCRLQIDVLDARGHIVRRAFTSYLPRPVFNTYRGIPGRSMYAAYLDVRPPVGGRVRVSAQRQSAD